MDPHISAITCINTKLTRRRHYTGRPFGRGESTYLHTIKSPHTTRFEVFFDSRLYRRFEETRHSATPLTSLDGVYDAVFTAEEGSHPHHLAVIIIQDYYRLFYFNNFAEITRSLLPRLRRPPAELPELPLHTYTITLVPTHLILFFVLER